MIALHCSGDVYVVAGAFSFYSHFNCSPILHRKCTIDLAYVRLGLPADSYHCTAQCSSNRCNQARKAFAMDERRRFGQCSAPSRKIYPAWLEPAGFKPVAVGA